MKQYFKFQYIFNITLLLFFYLFIIEPFNIKVVNIETNNPTLESFFNRYKVILLSDIHVSSFGIREKYVRKIINDISPDIIFLVGDYVKWSGNYDQTFNFLKSLKSTYGIFGVLGDSDYINSRKACNYCHNFEMDSPNLKILFLKNESIVIGDDESKISLTGIETFRYISRETINLLSEDKPFPEIILSHKQLDSKSLKQRKSLVLSGDTHGGQVFMPSFIWKKFWGNSKGPIRCGSVNINQSQQIVTKGIGTGFFPIRFFCPPEIIQITYNSY